MLNQQALLIGTALQSWHQIIDRTGKKIASFSDEDLQSEVAPGKNRLYYLVGHLAAVHDRLLPLLRIGERLYPELDEQFLTTADRKFTGVAATPEKIRQAWLDVGAKLSEAFAKLQPEEWLERHDSVSEEDFAKEPLRNRLAVLMSRTNHASFHEGQMRLVR